MDTVKKILEEFNACTHLVVRAFDRFDNCISIHAGHANRLICCPAWRKTVHEACELLHGGTAGQATLSCQPPPCHLSEQAPLPLYFTACYADPAMPDLGVYVFGPYTRQPSDFPCPCKPEKVIPYLVELLQMISSRHLLQSSGIAKAKSHSYQIQRCLEFVRSRIWGEVTLREAAEHLGISESYLSRLFKKEMDCSFTEFINRLRIERSCALLDDPSYSILEVAVAVGFSSQSYFNRIFKKLRGVSPQQYRQPRPAAAGGASV